MPTPADRMGDADRSSPPVSPRRRWPLVVAVALALLLAASYWASRPSQVTGAVLAWVERSLGLQITAADSSEYRLGDHPTLVLRDVDVRQPGAADPLLRARRIELSLPWSTLRSGGDALVVRRLELDAPQLDLAAWQAWQATRPPAPPRLATFTDGLRVSDGRLIGGSWSVEGIDVEVPAFHPDRPVAGTLAGRYRTARMAVPFSLHAALTRPARGAGLGLAGNIEVQAGTWRLPMQVTARGRLHQGDDGVGLDALRYAADARYVGGEFQEAFALGLGGRLRYRDKRLTLAPLGVALEGQASIPALQAGGRLALDDTLALVLDGTLAQWPQAWPALPEPLASSGSSLPFVLQYGGAPDLSGDIALRLAYDGTRFDGAFRLPEVLAWMEVRDTGTPLPPLRGRLSSPRLEIAGAQLHGVEIDFDDTPFDDAGDGQPPAR